VKEVSENLFVGDEADCRASGEKAVVHACKTPCHQDAVGYRGSLPQDHEEYLVSSQGSDLYLNIVDMDSLEKEYTEPILNDALDFIEEKISNNQVLIHCNQGRSRSPGIALLFLAKRRGEISDSSYREAKKEFQELYSNYRPGRGIDSYLRKHWQEID
jgi:hypothetical protein